MSTSSSPTRLLILIFILALTIRVFFLSLYHHEGFYQGLSVSHGEIGFNMVHHNKWFTLEKIHFDQMFAQQSTENRLVDPDEIPFSENPQFQRMPITDTPYYGTLLGLIWQITPDQKYIYMQALQIILDALMIFLIFAIGKNLFTRKIGLLSAFLYAICLPIAKLSMFALRDIWGAFGYIILLFFFSKAFHQKPKQQITSMLLGGTIFSFCALLRPNIALFPFFFLPFVFFFWKPKLALRNIAIFITTTFLLFWLPLVSFNLHTYQRPFVGPIGHGLWAGLGEFENPFGAKLLDEDLTRIVREAGYSYEYGTPEFDDVIKAKAMKAISERPDVMISHMLKRIPNYLAIQFSVNPEYNVCRQQNSLLDCKLANPLTLIMNPYQIGYILLGILAFALYKGRRKCVLFCFLVPLYTFLTLWQSHFEPRYILIGNPPFVILTAVAFFLVFDFQKYSTILGIF